MESLRFALFRIDCWRIDYAKVHLCKCVWLALIDDQIQCYNKYHEIDTMGTRGALAHLLIRYRLLMLKRLKSTELTDLNYRATFALFTHNNIILLTTNLGRCQIVLSDLIIVVNRFCIFRCNKEESKTYRLV